jgi:RNA polymerase sigma-70 factor (ECF subfamily)
LNLTRETSEVIDNLFRSESRRILATLVRLLGDFDLAEEALQDAFAAAWQQWPTQGIPSNPRAWLVSAGRFKAIDRLRRRGRFDAALARLVADLDDPSSDQVETDDDIEDDRLRLIFTCCHPAVTPDARVAMTLREVCGLTTEEIASAFLTSPPTVAQRIVRAKSRIRDLQIPYEIPGKEDLPERIDAVLQVVYLVFNEGYSASSGDSLMRTDLADEAIRLGRMLVGLLEDPEVAGLLALMLLNNSRRAARTTDSGELILLSAQDRGLWDQEAISEASALIEQAVGSGSVGYFVLQAAIASVHAQAHTAEQTDWARIVSLYDLLLRASPSPVVELNRAVAVAMIDGPEAGLALIDSILERKDLEGYYLAHSARADLLRRLGEKSRAAAAYEIALSLVRQEPERRFLTARLREVADGNGPRDIVRP